MFYALTWAVVLLLLALWSFMAWAFHAATAWAVSNTGVLAGGSLATQDLRMPEWLAPWVSPELVAAFASVLSSITPAIKAVVDQAPALASGLSVATWAIWGIGSVLLVVLGLVVSGLITAARRRGSTASTTARSPTVAG